MVRANTINSEMELKIRGGCNCCGWPGDPFLSMRPVPRSKGTGWAVLLVELGSPAVIIYRSDRQQPEDPYAIDHRVITYLHEARKNWEKARDNRLLDELVKHDAKVDADARKQEAEMAVEMSKFVGSEMRRAGITTKKHKIDKRKN